MVFVCACDVNITYTGESAVDRREYNKHSDHDEKLGFCVIPIFPRYEWLFFRTCRQRCIHSNELNKQTNKQTACTAYVRYSAHYALSAKISDENQWKFGHRIFWKKNYRAKMRGSTLQIIIAQINKPGR